MKQNILPLLLASLLVVAASCGGDKKQEGSTDSTVTAQKKGPLEAKPEEQRSFPVALAGSKYDVSVHRRPDASLPKVKDELGQEFLDNSVEVVVTKDGAQFFSKTFTKDAFADYLTKDENARCVLLGMVYDEEHSSASTICLAAQVGIPDVEDGPAFTIEIKTSDGSCSIVRDVNADTTKEDSMGD